MSQQPTFREFARYFLRLGFVSFGGPAGQISMLHRDLVDARGWVGERMFMRALGFCMALPGPEAHQLAVYIGWRLFGWRGGAAAGLLFLLPSVLLLLGLSALALTQGQTPLVAGLFRGVGAAVVAIVAQAVWRMGKKALWHPVLYGFAAASLLMGYSLHLKFHGIVVAAALMGIWLGAVRPDIFCRGGVCEPEDDGSAALPPGGSPWRRLGRLAALFAGLWLAVDLTLLFIAGPGTVLPKIFAFFTRASFLSFGGAYAVLSYVSDMALRQAWLPQEQIVLALGLAETTPGPLIMAAQHVGFAMAYASPAGLPALVSGVLGGLAATCGLFLPSFFLVFAGAPHIEALTGNPRVQAALTGITAAVVGVVLKLGLAFAGATLWPGGSPDYAALALAVAAGLALWRLKAGVPLLVLACGVAGAVITLAG